MPYCTQADIEALLPPTTLAELTAEVGGVPDPTVVAAAIAQAQAEIDSYLGKRYVLPFTETPPRVKTLAVDLAVYHLYARRDVMPEGRRDRYKDAVAFLKDVAAGRAEIVEAAGAELPGDAGDVTEISSAERVFSRTKMSDW